MLLMEEILHPGCKNPEIMGLPTNLNWWTPDFFHQLLKVFQRFANFSNFSSILGFHDLRYQLNDLRISALPFSGYVSSEMSYQSYSETVKLSSTLH